MPFYHGRASNPILGSNEGSFLDFAFGLNLTLRFYAFKVEQIKFKHYNKKISLETQLKNLVSSQLKEASEGTDKLAASMGLLKTVRDKYVGMPSHPEFR